MLPGLLHATREDSVLILLLSLLACSTQDMDTAPSGDTGILAGTLHPLETPEDIREVVLVNMMTGQLAYGALMYVQQNAGEPDLCPLVEETGPGTWSVEGCSDPELGVVFEGSFTVSGFEWSDKGFVPGTVEVVWDEFTTTVTKGPGGAWGRQVYDGGASFELLEDKMGGGRFDLTFVSEGFPCEVVAAGGVSERVWTISDLERSSLWTDGTDEVSGTIEVGGVGAVSLDGTMGWDYAACSTEPVDGSLTLVGEPTVTLTFDGANACDGSSSYSGDQEGEVSWGMSG
jgi:hypothetical protein